MGVGEHIHWYFFDGCNLDCVPCFQPHIHYKAPPNRLKTLARILVDNDVEKVILGGGEPLLEKHLDEILRILKQGDIYVSLHTNGTLLDNRRITRLSGLVDDIAIPIDSANRETQRELRGDGFLPVFDSLHDIAAAIKGNEMGLGYHTVFTMANHKDMPAIYAFIRNTDFDYWRIYEFNDYLAYSSLTMKKLCTKKKEQKKFLKRMEAIRSLRGTEGPQEKAVDKLFPLFKKASRRMRRYKDPRIQFAPIAGVEEPYMFLDNAGDITTYDCLSGTRRIEFGNILQDGFDNVLNALRRYASALESVRHKFLIKKAH